MKNTGSSGRGLTGREVVLLAGLMSVLWKKRTQEFAFPVKIYGKFFYILGEGGWKSLKTSLKIQQNSTENCNLYFIYLQLVQVFRWWLSTHILFWLNSPFKDWNVHKYTNILLIFVHMFQKIFISKKLHKILNYFWDGSIVHLEGKN